MEETVPETSKDKISSKHKLSFFHIIDINKQETRGRQMCHSSEIIRFRLDKTYLDQSVYGHAFSTNMIR